MTTQQHQPLHISNQRLLILGAGGHAKCVAELAQTLGIQVLGFLDDQQANWGKPFFGLPVLGGIDVETVCRIDPTGMVIAIGNNRVRQTIVEKFTPLGEKITWMTLHHPSAIISPSARIGIGSVVMAGAIINAEAQIGAHVIIGSGAIVEHECVVADYAHIASGARLGGGVQIGTRTIVDTGGIVKRLVRIADDVVVQTGAVVANHLVKDS